MTSEQSEQARTSGSEAAAAGDAAPPSMLSAREMMRLSWRADVWSRAGRRATGICNLQARTTAALVRDPRSRVTAQSSTPELRGVDSCSEASMLGLWLGWWAVRSPWGGTGTEMTLGIWLEPVL